MDKNTQDHYTRLSAWAESTDAENIAGTIERRPADAGPDPATRDMLAAAMGRPNLDPGRQAGASPRRQVRLPARVSEQLDALAAAKGVQPSVLMREAITDYLATHS